MKKLKIISITTLAVLGFSACSHYQGALTNSTAITNGDFKVIGKAMGTSKSTYVLGLGGFTHEGMAAEAKKVMDQNFPLKAGQVFANTSVDFKTSHYVLYKSVQVLIYADIVQFGKIESAIYGDTLKSNEPEKSTMPLGPIKVSDITFSVQEEVLVKINYYDFKKLKISKIGKRNSEFGKAMTENGIVYNRPNSSIFKLEGTYKVPKIGDIAVGDSVSMFYLDQVKQGARIIGMGNNSFVAQIKKSSGKIIYRKLSYDKIIKKE